MTLTKQEVTRYHSIKYNINGISIEKLKDFVFKLEDQYGPDAKISVQSEWDYDEYTAEVYVTWKELETDVELKERKRRLAAQEAWERSQYEKFKEKFESS